MEFAVWLKKLKQELCNNLEEWDGAGGGREFPEGGGHIFTYSDSCSCMAETKAIL